MLSFTLIHLAFSVFKLDLVNVFLQAVVLHVAVYNIPDNTDGQ